MLIRVMNPLHLDLQCFDQIAPACEQLREQVSKAVIGQQQTVDLLLTALLCHGHVLLVGVPGLAKTRLVRALGCALDLSTARVQFTADLMPTDIVGTELLRKDAAGTHRILEFVQGPVFTSLLLADEINRASPRTQAALLEAMAERQVTVAGQTHPLPEPFMVIATQNPIEQQGTYPLPEAQLDRFMFSYVMTYPSDAQEMAIAMLRDESVLQQIKTVATQQQVSTWAKLIRQMPISDVVAKQAVQWVRATRPSEQGANQMVKDYVQWGAGPRASQYLLLAASAQAAMQGKPTATLDHPKQIAPAVLCHRLVLNFAASADHITQSKIVNAIMTN
ncbi:MAG: AAA family ATPase [Phycisphaeraceae bacterium]|nr:AAA family ATPase [Phycisphaeraceae bacterium]